MSRAEFFKQMRKEIESAYEWTEELTGISTGSIAIDRILGKVAGFPRKRMTEVIGWECLPAETFIHFTTFVPGAGSRRGRPNEPRAQDTKGGTIERLYERFHRLQARGKGRRLDPASRDAVYYAPSVNSDDRIFLNRIVDVVATGDKPCFQLLTAGGHEILATAEHKFYTGTGYLALGELSPGDSVMVHANTPHTGRQEKGPDRKYLYVRYHPVAGIKNIRDTKTGKIYPYKRLARSRAVVEAAMNGWTLEEYLRVLNSWGMFTEAESTLEVLSREQQVHHKDENHLNDALENLQVITPTDHGQLHALARQDKLRFEARPDKITSILPAGTRRTYDIQMAAPFNNFVAEKFVVHNSSGKTTLCLQACAFAQQNKLHATYIDTERAVDLAHARLLHFDFENPEKGAYLTPRTLEETFTIIEGLITEVKTDLLICDSIAAMVPQSQMDSDMNDVSPLALRARFLSDKLPRIANIASQNNVAVVFVNQLRMKIETGWGARRGKPQEHSPGGSALRFYASLRLQLKQIKKEQMIKKVTDPVSGKEIEIPIQGLHNAYAFKNKISDPYQETNFYIRFDPDNTIYGIDNLQTVIDAAKAQGILIEKKGGYVAFEGTAAFKSRDGQQVYEYLLSHPDALDEIRVLLRAKGLF